MNILKFIITIAICLVANNSIAAPSSLPQNQCANFDSIALQFALVQKKMQSPLNLEQIQQSLGPGSSTTSSIATTYSWTNKDLVLLVQVNGNNISKVMLNGNKDSSITSKRMEQIHEKLKSATSIWSIEKIQNHLGRPGYVTNNKLQNYNWYCGNGSLEIIADQNNNVTAATISYRSSQESIDAKFGPSHPEWDVITDSLGVSYRAWQRTF